MNSNLEHLRRQLEGDPENEELRSTLIIALRRAGFDVEAQKLIKGRFHCPVTWEEHTATGEDSRHCETCDKPVYFVNTLAALEDRAKKQECIVAPMNLVDSYCEKVSRVPVPDLSKGPHCLNARPENRANLSRLIHYPENDFLMNVGPSFIIMLRKKQRHVPREERVVILLESEPISPTLLEAYKNVLEVKRVELQFASEKEIARLLSERARLFPRIDTNFRGGLGV